MKRHGINNRARHAEKKKAVYSVLRRQGMRLLLSGLAVVIALAGIFAAQKAYGYAGAAEWLKIKKVEVRGVVYADPAEVLSGARIVIGSSMIHLTISDIKKRIKKNLWIKEVRINRSLTGTVSLEVVERRPIALVNLYQVYYTDSDGFLWPLQKETCWNVPAVSGLRDTLSGKNKIHQLQEKDRRLLRAFLDQLHKKPERSSLGVSQIDFSEDGIVRMRMESSPITVLIRRDSVGKNLSDLHDIFSIAQSDTGAFPEYINLAYVNMAFVR
jgi:cell division septal protein FtsQ